ncbi:MAG: DNA double-strand break repair nuclease NurA [Vicinamibacteria bacterium]
MIDSGFRVTLDPWSAEYDASLLLAEADEPDARVDLRVETAEWRALRPAAAPPFAAPCFVDGVRRVDHRLRIVPGAEGEGGTRFGLLGTFAVGACASDVQPGIVHEIVSRVACVGGGLVLPSFEVPRERGRMALLFQGHTVAENTPLAPVQGLQNAMRRAEAVLAAEIAERGGLVFLDGPLTFAGGARGAVVGFVKRLLRAYLPADAAALLPRLDVGERTPLFLVAHEAHPRYSWYARIAHGRAVEDPLTGVVRLETAADDGRDAARARADASACLLPAFASDPAHDPRAPQNLLPIGGLESRLRHLMGDPLMVRRAIESYLHARAAA